MRMRGTARIRAGGDWDQGLTQYQRDPDRVPPTQGVAASAPRRQYLETPASAPHFRSLRCLSVAGPQFCTVIHRCRTTIHRRPVGAAAKLHVEMSGTLCLLVLAAAASCAVAQTDVGSGSSGKLAPKLSLRNFNLRSERCRFCHGVQTGCHKYPARAVRRARDEQRRRTWLRVGGIRRMVQQPRSS